MKVKSTKSALLMSFTSLLLCFAMLIGCTFAWFTDSVTSGVNKIQAGNLDIDVLHTSASVTTAESIKEQTNLFRDASGNAMLWEPGAMSYENFTVINKGNLALKYNMTMNPVEYNNLDGKSLMEALKVMVLTDGAILEPVTREAVADLAWDSTDVKTLADFKKDGGELRTQGAEEKFQVIVYWQPTANDDLWNANNGKTTSDGRPLYINFGVSVMATQLTHESDSFDNKYDIDTPWMGGTDAEGLAANTDATAKTVKIESAEQLAAFAAAVNSGNTYVGYTVTLEKDIDLNNVEWTPIGSSAHAFNGVFDGNNHTILNLKVSGTNYVGLFGNCFNHGTIQNVKVVNATVTGHNKVAVILGGGYADITNCDVENATVTATTWLVNNKWDDGDKAGAIAGQIKESAAYTVKDCDAKNVTVTGYRDVGGLVGYGYEENVFTNNTVTNVTIINDRTHNYQNYTVDSQFDVREIVGEYAGTIDASNTATNVTIKKIAPIVVPENATPEQTQTAVNNAVAAASAGDIVVLPNTDDGVKLPAVASGVTLKGDGTTKINAKDALPNINGATLDGFVMDCGQSNYHGFTHSDAVIKNCTVNGLLFSYNAGGEQVFENCTFVNDKESGEYNMWAYGAVTYKNCTFKSYGKFVNVYNEGASHYDVTFDGCTFENLGASNKAAINIKETCGAEKLNIAVTINNCSVTNLDKFPVASEADATYVASGLWMVDDRIADHTGSNINVTVDGVVKYTNGQPVPVA